MKSLLRAAVSIVLTQGVTSAVGYLFWVRAARMCGLAASGVAGGLVSAVNAVCLLSAVGVAIAAVPALAAAGPPGSLRARRIWWTAVAATLGLGGLAAVACVAVSPLLLPDLTRQSAPVVAAFALSVPANCLGVLMDYAALGIRRSGFMVVRGAVASLARLVLLLGWPLLADGPPGVGAVLVCWLASTGLSVLAAGVLLARCGLARHWRASLADLPDRLRGGVREWSGHHLTSVGGAGATFLLPVLVLDRLGAEAAGVFYPVWMLGGVFFMISPAVASALLAEAPRSAGVLAPVVRRCGLILAALLAVPLAVVLLAPQLPLGVFGPAYVRRGTGLLILLALSAIPDAATNVAVAVLRLRGRLARTTALNGAMGTLACVLAWVLMPGLGVAGAGLAWLLAQSVGALSLPWLVRVPAAASAPAEPHAEPHPEMDPGSDPEERAHHVQVPRTRGSAPISAASRWR